jgi:hypothetical protein
MTNIEREQILVASILDDPKAKWGPNVSTALAYAPDYWESVEARDIAQRIVMCHVKGVEPSPGAVKKINGWIHVTWINHPTFSSSNSLPMSCAETVAGELLPGYRDKQIRKTIGDAWEKLQRTPEKAKEVAATLKHQLEAWT